MEADILEMEAEYKERQKETAGRTATFAWIASGIYLYFVHDEASFLSWTAFGFFVIGMYLTAIVFGWAIYLTERLLAFGLMKAFGSPTAMIAGFVWALGILLFVGWLAAIFLSASAVFNAIELP